MNTGYIYHVSVCLPALVCRLSINVTITAGICVFDGQADVPSVSWLSFVVSVWKHASGLTRLSHKPYNVGILAITKSIHVVEGILRPYGIIFVSYLFNAFSAPHATLLTIICYTPDCAADFKRITLKVYI